MGRRLGLALLLAVCAGWMGTGCAQLHQVQIGEVDAQAIERGRRFEIKISELGLDVEQAAEVASLALSGMRGSERLGEAGELVKLFQMGPKTGNPVFHVDYSDRLFELLQAECPRGRITGLTSVRESANYPVVSGEIVKVVGYCVEDEEVRG